MSAETTPAKAPMLRPAWQPGQSGNPAGRPKGSRNKISDAFINALCTDFEEHGATVIVKVRLDDPSQYLRLVSSVVVKIVGIVAPPKGPWSEWSDEKLDRAIAALSDHLDAEGGEDEQSRD